jgi:hypothetical protein
VSGERGPKGDHGQQGEAAGKAPALVAGLLIAVVLVVLVLTSVQTVRQSDFTAQLRKNAIAGCERQNAVRAALVDFIHDEAAQTKQLPPSFFPGIPPLQFKLLQQQEQREARRTEKALAPVDCEAAFPED